MASANNKDMDQPVRHQRLITANEALVQIVCTIHRLFQNVNEYDQETYIVSHGTLLSFASSDQHVNGPGALLLCQRSSENYCIRQDNVSTHHTF